METIAKTAITVQNTINAPIERVWEYWTSPSHITKWNFASDDWHSPSAANDLRTGGKFASRMEAKDGSMGFDFEGVYEEVRQHELIRYTMADGRKVTVAFTNLDDKTKVVETFEAENTNPVELQRTGWQTILDNFKKYVESH
jgi:uncharacterized protein YndB with AHSA1/START domain